MKRHLLDVLAGISLVLCIASTALFAVDRHKTYFIHVEHFPSRYIEIQAERSQLLICTSIFSGSNHPVGTFPWTFHAGIVPRSWFATGWSTDMHVGGIRFVSDLQSVAPQLFQRLSVLILPAWLLLLSTGLLPVFWVKNKRVKSRTQCGGPVCQRCGYDLRATPNRCPECGMVSPKTI